MKVTGVIAEFDPFHNGHAYFLRRARELTSADFIIAVMSGDFTQRGMIACAPKSVRAEAALACGADLVIELPVAFSTASAEYFATGGVSILDGLRVTDAVCFGTEDDDIASLKKIAECLADESDAFREHLDGQLRSGMNYPAARLEAVKKTVEGSDGTSLTGELISDLLSRPNNILAVEYIKALMRLSSDITPVCIRREGCDHNSTESFGLYSSGANIRRTLSITKSLDALERYLPEKTLPIMREHFGIDLPLFPDDLSSLMRYRLLMEDASSLMEYADMNSSLAKRIINKRNEFVSVSQFTELIKTKNLTYTRISRALLHMLLSIKKQGTDSYVTPRYARVLGFRKEASSLLDHINKNSAIPLISRTADYKKQLSEPYIKMFEEDLRASGIYDSVIRDIYGTDVTPDISRMVTAKDDMILNS
ncbi:MAG: nucleotidyltransferase family protein [Lachnospiraceae bacterium]|nr:nucleotidyltransferase family protein [Lachnospiraceae bacterium]